MLFMLRSLIQGRGLWCLRSPLESAVTGQRLLSNATGDEYAAQSIHGKNSILGIDRKFVDKVNVVSALRSQVEQCS